MGSHLEEAFSMWLRQNPEIPEPVTEYRFMVPPMRVRLKFGPHSYPPQPVERMQRLFVKSLCNDADYGGAAPVAGVKRCPTTLPHAPQRNIPPPITNPPGPGGVHGPSSPYPPAVPTAPVLRSPGTRSRSKHYW